MEILYLAPKILAGGLAVFFMVISLQYAEQGDGGFAAFYAGLSVINVITLFWSIGR